MLSQNNAEQRLLEKAYNFKLVDEKRYKDFLNKEEEYKKFIKNKLKKKENNLIYKQTKQKNKSQRKEKRFRPFVENRRSQRKPF